MNRKSFFICALILLLICPTLACGKSTSASSVTPLLSAAPPSRFLPGIQFDSENGRVIMFGGGTMEGERGDTWSYVYSTNTWTQIQSSINPSARHSPGMVYDPANEIMILFGGWVGSSRTDETWIFDCNTDEWNQVFPETSPPARLSPGMAFDASNSIAVLFGGTGYDITYHDTWTYNYSTNTWTEMSPITHPSGRYGPCMAYDSDNSRSLLFSGNAVDGMNPDMWEYDYVTDTWNEIDTYSHPLGRKWGSMIYDSDRQVCILFGGDCNEPEFIDDTWIYNCTTDEWQAKEPEVSPSARASSGLVYDSLNQKAILFGGHSQNDAGYITLDDTWSYDYPTNNWTIMSAAAGSTPITTGTTTSSPPIPLELMVATIGGLALVLVVLMVWRLRK